MPLLASEDGLLFDILVALLVVVLYLVCLYAVVGVLVLPVWALGALLRVRWMRRAIAWWALPWLIVEWGDGFVSRLTAPRDASRWRRAPAEPAPAPAPQPQAGDWARGLGWLVVFGLAVIGAFTALIYWHDLVIRPLGDSTAGELITVLALLAAVAVIAAAWVLANRYSSNARPTVWRFSAGAAAVLTFFTWSMFGAVADANRLVEDYCSYGAVSDAQLATCKTHVSAAHIRQIDTPAARFALDGSSDAECGETSGPFCSDVVVRRSYEEQRTNDFGPGG